jgi:RNA-directed DNA polymerase
VKRFSVQAVRRALVGKGNLRTRISDRIEGLDPYKREAVKNLKEIFDEEALRGWVQIQKLFDGIPKITTLENAWSVVAHNPELVALLIRGVELEKNRDAIQRSRKLLKLTEIETEEDSFCSWLFNSRNRRLPNILKAEGFSATVRIRWSLAKKLNENVTSFKELLNIASAVEELPPQEANTLLKESINHLKHVINKITKDEATCFTDYEMCVFSNDKELIPLIYEDELKSGYECIKLIEKLQISYRRNLEITQDVLNRLSQRDWEASGESAEKIEVNRTAELAVKKLVPSAEHIYKITNCYPLDKWRAMSTAGYKVLQDLFPKGSIREHWTFNKAEIAKYLKEESLSETMLTKQDIEHLNQSWSNEEKLSLIESQKYLVIDRDSSIWKTQSLKTLLLSACARDTVNANKFLEENLTRIKSADDVISSIVLSNNKKSSQLLKTFFSEWPGSGLLKTDGINAKSWSQLIARTVGTKDWLIARENSLIDKANLEEIFHAIEISSENRILETFKKIAVETINENNTFTEIEAKKIISCFKTDLTFVEILGPHLNNNHIQKLTELSELDSSTQVIRRLYDAAKIEYKVNLWQMQLKHITTAEGLIELSIEGINKGYKTEWQHRWKHVIGSVEDRARALALCTSSDPSRLKKIKGNFTEEALTKAMLWASKEISEKQKFKKVYLELISALGLRHATTLQWLLLQRKQQNPSGRKLDHLYEKYEIPKKSGKTRVISAPNSGLKRIQKSININLLEPLGAHQAAYGFVKGRSIVGNASNHIGKAVVVNADVQNCFPTVRWPLVLAALKRDLAGKISSDAISALIDICISEEVLPIGAPTSPALLNRVLYKTDEILSKQAAIKNCTYSRYADDLTFSGDERAIGLIGTTRRTLAQIGLELDDKKTNIYRRGRRQMCTGLVVNDKVNIPRRIRKRIRASVHAYELGKDLFWEGNLVGESSLRGRLEFLKMVSPSSSENLLNRYTNTKKIKKKETAKRKAKNLSERKK